MTRLGVRQGVGEGRPGKDRGGSGPSNEPEAGVEVDRFQQPLLQHLLRIVRREAKLVETGVRARQVVQTLVLVDLKIELWLERRKPLGRKPPGPGREGLET